MNKLIANLKNKMEVTLVPALLEKEVNAINKYIAKHPMALCMISPENIEIMRKAGCKL